MAAAVIGAEGKGDGCGWCGRKVNETGNLNYSIFHSHCMPEINAYLHDFGCSRASGASENVKRQFHELIYEWKLYSLWRQMKSFLPFFLVFVYDLLIHLSIYASAPSERNDANKTQISLLHLMSLFPRRRDDDGDTARRCSKKIWIFLFGNRFKILDRHHRSNLDNWKKN